MVQIQNLKCRKSEKGEKVNNVPYYSNDYIPNPLIPKVILSQASPNEPEYLSDSEESSSPEFALFGDNESIGPNIVHMGSSNYDPRFKPIKYQSKCQPLYKAVWINPRDRENSHTNYTDPTEDIFDYSDINSQSSAGPRASMKSYYNMPKCYYDYFKLGANAMASCDIMDYSKDNLNKALRTNDKTISILFSDFPFPSNSKFEIPDSDE